MSVEIENRMKKFWLIGLVCLLGQFSRSASAQDVPKNVGDILPAVSTVLDSPNDRVTEFRIDPDSRHLMAYVVSAAPDPAPASPEPVPQQGAWHTVAGLDGLTRVALKVTAAGALVTGADPGGSVQQCTDCIVIGGLNGLTPTALKVGADGTVAISLGTLPNGTTATTQAPGDNTTAVATDAFVTTAVGGTPSNWINLVTTSGAKHDAHMVVFNSSAGGTLATITSGNCSASDVGKSTFAIAGLSQGSGNSYSATSGVTVSACVPGTSFSISGATMSGNFTGNTAWIGTDDSTAINACLAAALAQQGVCYAPGGLTAYLHNSQISITGTTGMKFLGDSMDTTKFVFPPFLLTSLPANMNDPLLHVENMSWDDGAKAILSCGNYGIQLNAYAYRVRFSNWNCGGGGALACIYSSTDGVQLTEVESTGCFDGYTVASTGVSMFRPQISATRYALHNFDASTHVFGGMLSGGSAGFFADNQAGFGATWLEDVMIVGPNSGPGVQTLSGSTTWISGGIINGSKGCGSATNTTGINIVSGAIVHIGRAQICSNGTGFSINNAGALYDQGDNTYPAIGAGIYTGSSGTVNGRSFLTGTAYTNSTTTFSAVIGGSGEPFAWNVDAKAPLSVTCHLYYQAASTGGLNIEFTGPASPTSVAYGLNDPNAASTFNSSVATAFGASLGQAVTTATTNFDAIVSLSMLNGSTAGTVTLLAKSSAAAALTIQPGSYCQSQ